MLGTIQSMGTYTVTNKFKRRIPNSITDLSLGNYSIVYNNNCDNFTSLQDHLGLSITSITGSVGNCFKMTTVSAYGIINISNINLLNKTIVVRSSINYTGRFYFGCSLNGDGYAFQYDASGSGFSYVGKCVNWILTENIGPITSGSDTKILNTGYFHSLIISINSNGNIKWGLQQSNYYNGPTYYDNFNFLGGQLYNGSTSYVVDPTKKILAFNCYGETYMDTIEIYNSAV